MYTGAFIEAQRALQVGLVSEVVPDNQLEDAAALFVEPMLRTAPLGLRMTKQTLNSVLKIDDLNVVIDLEERAQSICGRGPDFEEAMQAFLEKRPPRYATSSPSV
jgi:enoyl-CoA hydratase